MNDRIDPDSEATRSAAGVDDRRHDLRLEQHVALTVSVDAQQFAGRSKNLSRAGVFFFSEDRLEVTVAIEEDGQVVARRGHLVRVERMNEETTGFAIEFDGGAGGG